MLRQLQYFQAIVRHQSFAAAARECAISASALSQQLQVLEHQLGVTLLYRKGRKKVELTPAGQYFYEQSLRLSAQFAEISEMARRIDRAEDLTLTLGILSPLSAPQLQLALSRFRSCCPQVKLQLIFGGHEDLFARLRQGSADVLLSDQRRAFSEEYFNLPLCSLPLELQIGSADPLAALKSVEIDELAQHTCIVVCTPEEERSECEYFRTVLGFKSSFLRVASMEQAALCAAAAQGFVPADALMCRTEPDSCQSLQRLILTRRGERVWRHYCIFAKKELQRQEPALSLLVKILSDGLKSLSPES